MLDYGGIWSELFADTDTVFHEVRVGDILFNGQKFCEPSNLNEYSIYVCEALKLLNLEVLDTEEDGSLSFAFFKNVSIIIEKCVITEVTAELYCFLFPETKPT